MTDSTQHKCSECKEGRYVETSIHDDIDGVLHCDSCRHSVSRWNEKKEDEKKEMRLLVCGDREWNDIEAIIRVLKKYPPETTTVIHGACKGADVIAGVVASALGMKVEEYPADWEQFGRAAGPIRNKQMLVEGKPDKVLAFHRDLTKSKGTKNMVEQAEAAKIRVERYEQ